MSKVTSKFQVTIPRKIAKAYAILPGGQIHFEPAGEVIRVRIGNQSGKEPETEKVLRDRLGWFDESTSRQGARNKAVLRRLSTVRSKKGWNREDLYTDRIRRD